MVREWQDGQLVLNQPAGHVENNESSLDALIRETREESGWQVKPIGLLGLYTYTPYPGADTYHRLCFVCEAQFNTHNDLDADIESSVWLTYEEIQHQPKRSPLVLKCIDDALTKTLIPLSFLSDSFL